MKIKKNNILVFIRIFFLFFIVNAYAAEDVTRNVAEVNLAYANQSHENKLLSLAENIFQQPHYYANDVKAKLYILLSTKSSLDGNYDEAFQFVTQGLRLSSIDVSLKLELLLTLAESYYLSGQNKEALQIANQAIVIAKTDDKYRARVIALSYRAIAYSLLGEYKLAAQDILQIEATLDAQDTLTTDSAVLDTFAIAYYYLDDFSGAIALHNKVVSIKAELESPYRLDKTYYNLALAYEGMGKKDDAFNAFWEAKKIAESNLLMNRLAYIQLGLAQALLSKNEAEEAYHYLKKTQKYFSLTDQKKPYLSSLILLAKAALKTERFLESEQILLEAEQLASEVTLMGEQVELYHQLHEYYKSKNKYQLSLHYLSTYLVRYQQAQKEKNDRALYVKSYAAYRPIEEHLLNRTRASDKVEAQLKEKLHFKQQIIILLSSLAFMLFIVSIILWLRKRTYQLTTEYNDNERPEDHLYSPSQTKYLYQLNYKKARKYDYSLAIGYIMVTNWTELSALVNKKVLDEISRTIACLINEAVDEYDYAGKLNYGQYLVFCPYQSADNIEQKLKVITEAMAIRSFANLGEFSINIGYSFGNPSVQDIDPYIFLSRLSERVSVKYTN